MTKIIKRSGVLRLTPAALEFTPSTKGIFVVRDIPTINGIVYIQYTENLAESLGNIIKKKQFSNEMWFDWYEVDNKEFGQDIAKKWIEKYSPKYNLS